jgi:hypothetical protein
MRKQWIVSPQAGIWEESVVLLHEHERNNPIQLLVCFKAVVVTRSGYGILVELSNDYFKAFVADSI